MTPSTEIKPTVPAMAAGLGYAGLIPFIALAVLLWWLPDDEVQRIHEALLGYGAVILSFIGAVHWGLAMSGGGEGSQRQFVFSVVPPLLGWLALLVPLVAGYSILILSFAGVCIYDSFITRRNEAPGWYPRIRVPITTLVVLCLIVAGLAAAS
jgi:hypothetical protein